MKVCFEDIGHMSATFAVLSGEGGEPVKVCDNSTVQACGDGEVFFGVLESLRGGYGAVQMHGFVTMPYSGTAPALGYNELMANGAGGVKVASGGKKCLVVNVDAAVKAVTFEM